MNCDGKCYLAKMQKEEREKKANDLLKQLQLEVLYISSASFFSIGDHELFYPVPKVYLPFDYSPAYSFLFSSRLAKPPQTA